MSTKLEEFYSFNPMYPEVLEGMPELDQFVPHIPVFGGDANPTIPIGEYDIKTRAIGALVRESPTLQDCFLIRLAYLSGEEQGPLPTGIKGDYKNYGPIAMVELHLKRPASTAVLIYDAGGDNLGLTYDHSYLLRPLMSGLIVNADNKRRYYDAVINGVHPTPQITSAVFARVAQNRKRPQS